jgi:hypothetical protein
VVQAPRIVSLALPIASFSLSKPGRCSAVGWVARSTRPIMNSPTRPPSGPQKCAMPNGRIIAWRSIIMPSRPPKRGPCLWRGP